MRWPVQPAVGEAAAARAWSGDASTPPAVLIAIKARVEKCMVGVVGSVEGGR